jgi:hypothetical protein
VAAVCGLSFVLSGYLEESCSAGTWREAVNWLYQAFERRQLMGDIEGTLGSGLASSGGGVAFDPEEIKAGPGVPTGDQKPSNESADVDNVRESGGGTEHRVPDKKG